MTESLAVRHRPRRFADVAGQRAPVMVLRAAALHRNPPQQLLLKGPSGTGKTTLARIFAAALFCETPAADGDACGACQTCLDVTGPGGRHPDVIELDAASHGGIDQIREIASQAYTAPMRAPWKLYIIDEAHGLTSAGGQAALRLIEEPPPHTLFALATTDPDKLPRALEGRCVHLEMLPPTRTEKHTNLARVCTREGWDVSPEVLDAVLDAADPALGVRGTVMMLEKLGNHVPDGQPLDPSLAFGLLGVAGPAIFHELTGAVNSGDRAAALEALDRALTGAAAPVVRAQLTAWAHTALREAVHAGAPEAGPLHWLSTIASSGTFEGALHLAVARMASPHLAGDLVALEALVARAEAAASGLSAAPADAAPAPQRPVDAEVANRRPTATPPAPAPATSRPADGGATAPNTHPTERPASERPAAQRPADTATAGPRGEQVTLPDPGLTGLINAVGAGAPRAALLLRRALVRRDGTHWYVQLAPSDAARATEVGFADRLSAAVTAAGGTLTLL